MGLGALLWVYFFVFILCRGVEDNGKILPFLNDTELIGSEKGMLHVVTSTECTRGYFDFQSLALKSTFDRVHQNGRLTRIVSCDLETALREEDMKTMDTLVVPNWSMHPVTHDMYSPYNRPVGLIFWLAERKPTAEWTLIVDPDMQFRQPFRIDDFIIPEGYALSSGYGYLKGVQNELADRHIGQVERRDDTYGGPKGRRADQAGAFFLMRTRDLLKIAPLWLKYTEDVRNDRNAWNLTGDQYVKPGGRAWISEMYGYAFAAAAAGIWHRIDSTIQYYPGYHPKDIPLLTHYGLNMQLGNYSFDKHQHYSFQSFACPPWNLDPNREVEEDKGLFPHPASPEQIETEDIRERYGMLMIIEAVNVLNQALCARHRRKCPSSDQLKEQCAKVDGIAQSLRKEFEKLDETNKLCFDDDERCHFWAERGECERNWRYMDTSCRAACHKCRAFIPFDNTREAKEDRQDDHNKEVIDDVPFGIELELVRCSKLEEKFLFEDPKCKEVIKRGYADLEDFLSEKSEDVEFFLECPKRYLTWAFGIVLVLAVLTTAVRKGRRMWRSKFLKSS